MGNHKISVTEEQRDNPNRFKGKTKGKTTMKALEESRPRPNPENRVSNMFNGLRNGGVHRASNFYGGTEPNPKAKRRGKKNKDPNYENLDYERSSLDSQSPSRQLKNTSVCDLASSDEEDANQRRSTKPNKGKKSILDQLKPSLNIKAVNKNRGTADSALDMADEAQGGGQKPIPTRKRSGERNVKDSSRGLFAELNDGWIPKNDSSKSLYKKKSGERGGRIFGGKM